MTAAIIPFPHPTRVLPNVAPRIPSLWHMASLLERWVVKNPSAFTGDEIEFIRRAREVAYLGGAAPDYQRFAYFKGCTALLERTIKTNTETPMLHRLHQTVRNIWRSFLAWCLEVERWEIDERDRLSQMNQVERNIDALQEATDRQKAERERLRLESVVRVARENGEL